MGLSQSFSGADASEIDTPRNILRRQIRDWGNESPLAVGIEERVRRAVTIRDFLIAEVTPLATDAQKAESIANNYRAEDNIGCRYLEALNFSPMVAQTFDAIGQAAARDIVDLVHTDEVVADFDHSGVATRRLTAQKISNAFLSHAKHELESQIELTGVQIAPTLDDKGAIFIREGDMQGGRVPTILIGEAYLGTTDLPDLVQTAGKNASLGAMMQVAYLAERRKIDVPPILENDVSVMTLSLAYGLGFPPYLKRMADANPIDKTATATATLAESALRKAGGFPAPESSAAAPTPAMPAP